MAFGILDLTGCLVPMARTGRGVTLWSFLAEEVTPFMVSAIRVFGLEVLAAEDEGMALPDQEAVGRELLRLVFDARDGGPELPAVLTDLIADPDNEAAATRLTGRLFQTFKADPGMTSAAAAMIARFYRRQADGGDVQALVGLGDLLYWDEPGAARAAYQDGHEDRRPLESHFGAWVVCTEQPGSFEVAGIDQNGTVLATLRYPSRLSRWQEFRSLPAGPGVVALTASLLRMRRRTGDTSVLLPTKRMVHVIARAAPATHTALPNSTHGSPP